jgi:solute carrier family 35 protein E3
MNVCSLGLRAAAACGLFDLKSLPFRQVLPIAACCALSTPLSNLSLSLNTIGFYQMMKILTTPYSVAIEMAFHGVQFSKSVLASLVLVTVGVAVATVNDINVS